MIYLLLQEGPFMSYDTVASLQRMQQLEQAASGKRLVLKAIYSTVRYMANCYCSYFIHSNFYFFFSSVFDLLLYKGVFH